jgi:hypothetical protein
MREDRERLGFSRPCLVTARRVGTPSTSKWDIMQEMRYYLERASKWVGLVIVDIERGGKLAFEDLGDESIRTEVERIADEAVGVSERWPTFERGRVIWFRRFEDGLAAHRFDIIAKKHRQD